MGSTKVKIFKDSVHGYIDVPVFFVKYLIDNQYFQRLRNIDQTGMRVLYPAAKHDRFSHSLGVFYLGQKAMDALYRDINNEILSEKNFNKYRILFLIACLLHDIGHTPFSHSLEEQILENSDIKEHHRKKNKGNNINSITRNLIEKINDKERLYCKNKGIFQCSVEETAAAPHEQLGSYLIFDKLEENIRALECDYNILSNDREVFDDDLCFIVRMIMGIRYKEYTPERQIRNCFIELLNGTNFDVDKLDYIIRDTQMSGISNVSVDVERLLGALCVITKTEHRNKVDLSKSNIKNLTISKIDNKSDKTFEMKGNFKGKIKISKGATIEIRAGSTIQMLKGFEQSSTRVAFTSGDKAYFSESTNLKQNNEWVNAENLDDFEVPVKILTRMTNNKVFSVYFDNAKLETNLKIEAKDDIEIHIFGKCSIKINGKFESIDSLKLFELEKLEGDISEVEILGDTFREAFTSRKEISENGYPTFSIGFKKQAINVIANVLEARNYLYLWICAHHKVVYYANFLIPVITKDISQHCGVLENVFPLWKLNYVNLDKLDDYYVWTIIKYLYSGKKIREEKKEYVDLANQLFSRTYDKSLYKSLAEFEMVFAQFLTEQKRRALEKLQIQTDTTKPLLEYKEKKDNKQNKAKNGVEKDKQYEEKEENEGNKKIPKYSAGYLNSDSIFEINTEIRKRIRENGLKDLKIDLSQVLYVIAEFKEKKLDVNSVYLDMGDETLPIGQIPLLCNDSIINNDVGSKYFYIYYRDEYKDKSPEKTRMIKEVFKDYLSK